ncbi:MAG: alpha/beta fold hydrolase [Actinomycetota bacterium]
MGETLFARLPDATVAYELEGGGEPLVWCHGLGSCRAGDRDVIDALAEHFTVLAYDARGHRESPPVTDEKLYTYPALSADLRALLDHVGWERAILAGASMGAATAARVAMEEPERPEALIIARPATSGGPASPQMQLLFRLGGEAIRSGGWDAAVAFLMTIPEAAERLAEDPDRLSLLREDWSRHNPDSIAAALIGIPQSGVLTPEVDIGSITAPTLVIPGNDMLHPTTAGETVASLIPGARLAPAFDGLPRDEEVRGLVRLIRDFVSGG